MLPVLFGKQHQFYAPNGRYENVCGILTGMHGSYGKFQRQLSRESTQAVSEVSLHHFKHREIETEKRLCVQCSAV